MKTVQAPSAAVSLDPTTWTINLAGIEPGMAFAIALGTAVFVSGALATIAVRRRWL